MQVQWMVLGPGLSLPALVTQTETGEYIAVSADWKVAEAAPAACDALQALAKAVEERIHRAVARSRTRA